MDWSGELPFLSALAGVVGQGLDVGIVVIDEHDRVALSNQPVATLLGRERAAFDGLAPAAFLAIVAAAVDTQLEALRESRLFPADGEMVVEEFEIKRPGRSIVRWVARRIFEPAPATIILLIDVTAQVDLDAGYHRLALFDALTGLPNRRQADLTMGREVARARRYEVPIAIALVDIDDFKEINEVAGHTAGDQVLASVGTVIAASIRECDFAARWGAAEFLMLMPNTDLPIGRVPCERVRENIAARVTTGAASVTVSIGVALHSSGDPVEVTLRNASDLLKRAKFDGKNCVRG